MPRPPRIAVLSFALVLGVVGGFLWLRDSSLVRVQQVTVTGASGPQAAAIRAAATSAAREMTTLHVQEGRLRAALARYPIVRGVRAEADFPKRLHVTVLSYEPVAQLVSPGGKVVVAGDGRVLRNTAVSSVPSIAVPVPPAGSTLRDPKTLQLVRLLGAAPAPLRARCLKAFRGPRGLTVALADGPTLAFGGAVRLAAKWAAAAAVLADQSSQGATSIDLRVPERPAAAGLEQVADQEPVAPSAEAPATPDPQPEVQPSQ